MCRCMQQFNLDGLEGRQFEWGRSDCLSLFRDFYRLNFGIEIRNYARPNNWDPSTINLVELCYQRERFNKITDWANDLRPADVLCMTHQSSPPAHFAVYLGENQIIHHLYKQISRREEFRPYFKATTLFVLRHPEVPDLTVKYPDTTITELLNARYHRQTP